MVTQAKIEDDRYHPQLRIYDKVLADISRERPLTGEGYRVLLCLLGEVGTQNKVPGPSKIAVKLGLHRQHVWQHYQQMSQDGYLVKNATGYQMHSLICWRGSASSRLDAIRRILVGNIMAIV